MGRIANTLAAIAFAGGGLGALPAAAADENVMIVFDGSNSMWGQIEGVAKIEIARSVMENLLGDWADTRNVGLMAYGHRRRGDCADIEILVQPGQDTRAGILDRIGAITPTGKTPLSSAVEQAAESLSYTDVPATVVLISDGLESCERDPCALAETLEKGGVGFTAHVVGFGLGDEDASALSCIAENTGGQYLSARNADELGQALSTLGTAVAAAPEPDPEPEPQPEPDYDVTISAPDTVLAGEKFEVSWTGTVSDIDYVTIVPVGADEGARENHFRVRDNSTGTLQAPGETGLYEVRYVLEEGRRTLASQPIEVTEPEVTISAPDTVLAGAKFEVSWTGTVSDIDYVTIVPVGADDGARENHFRVRDNSTGTLQAPGETGLYEVRYVLEEGRRTLASQPIEVTEPEVTISAPDTVLAGAKFEVSWTGTVSDIDYVTIVPVGADDGARENHFRVRDNSTGMLQAPGETGLYEVRYVLEEGRRTLASQPIEVTEPEVTISAPKEVRAGTTIRVTWTGTVSGVDYITIVPMGAEDGARETHFRVRGNTEGDLNAPTQTGLYEIRYVLEEGRRTLAAQPIEVLAEDAALESGASLDAPDSADAGAMISVGWTVENTSADQRLTIARADQAIFTWVSAVKLDGVSPLEIKLPDEPGSYELRLLDVSAQEVLARKPIQVD